MLSLMNLRIPLGTAALLGSILGLAAVCGDGSTETPPSSGEWADAFASSTFAASFASSETEDGVTSDYVLKLYKDGDDRFRSDFETTLSADGEDAGDDGTSLVILIQSPAVNAVCVGEVGLLAIFGFSHAHTCFIPDDFSGAEAFSAEAMLKQFSLEGVDRSDYSEDTIDGREARCYESQPVDDAEGEYAEVCFSREGWLLRIGGSGAMSGAPGSADAEDLKGVVDNSVFDAPYPFFEEAPSLEIRNESDVPIRVDNRAHDGSWADAGIEIDPGSTGTLQSREREGTASIGFGTFESPGWSHACDWDDAKSNEPFIVGNDTSNCQNPRRLYGGTPTPMPVDLTPGDGITSHIEFGTFPTPTAP